MTARKQTPEGAALKPITAYLQLCRLGKVRRVNAGTAKVGAPPAHPWAKDTRYRLKLAEKGHTDLVLELDGDPRSVYIESKRLGWKPPKPPKPDAAASTRKKYQDYLDQVAFQERQKARGNFACFATCAWDVFMALVSWGFTRVPVPNPPKRPQVRPRLQPPPRGPR